MKRFILLCGTAVLLLVGSAFAETKQYIIVLHTPSMIPASFEKAVQNAGGTVTARLPQIGTLGAASDNPDFATAIAADNNVDSVTEDVQYQMIPTPEQMNAQVMTDSTVTPPGSDAQTGPDPFYNPFQWDKKRIRASNQGSYSVQTGRHDVVVAVLDTGVEILPAIHPDLQGNLDAARSRSFVNSPAGDPNPAAWDDRNGHGTHCATSIGAPINGRGIVGVAPNITIVALKVLSDTGSGSFLWLAQALVYAGVNHFDVASMSLSGTVPHDQHGQTLTKIVQRAVNFARENGVTPVAALGNQNLDISDGSVMGPYQVLPAEVDGVIGVSATNFSNNKASYSNYGVGKTDVSGPGGDVDIPPPFGFVLAGWARDSIVLPASYVFAAGTSMACPQVAGVAALIISQYGDFTPNGNGTKPHMSPQQVEAILQQTANNQPCPQATTCDGGDGYSNYFGKGIVDALHAVTK